jgi:hypothetical protein
MVRVARLAPPLVWTVIRDQDCLAFAVEPYGDPPLTRELISAQQGSRLRVGETRKPRLEDVAAALHPPALTVR